MGVKLSGDTLFATLWHFTNRNGGTSEALVVALDKRTGDELWTVVLPDNGSGVLIQSAPAVSDNLVIVNTISAKTYAIDRTTKKVIWTFSANNPFLSTLAGATVFENTVYVDGGDGKLYALRAADGTVVWSAAYGTATTHDLLVTSRHVLFPTGAELHIVDRQNGNQILAIVQPHTTDPLFASAAEIANGFVLTTVGGAAWCFQEP
jgi:outer membrane protein assembly factor BamB